MPLLLLSMLLALPLCPPGSLSALPLPRMMGGAMEMLEAPPPLPFPSVPLPAIGGAAGRLMLKEGELAATPKGSGLIEAAAGVPGAGEGVAGWWGLTGAGELGLGLAGRPKE